MMLMASSMAPFHSLCQNNRNEAHHDFSHVLPMALTKVTCDADGTVKGIIAFF